MKNNLRERQSIFKGIISKEYFSNHPGIALQDKTGFKIDLAGRLIECKLNWDWFSKYRIRIFIADEPKTFEEINGQWTHDIEADYFYPNRSSYDVEYFSDWHETKYDTSLKLGDREIMNILTGYQGKWAYILFSAYETRVKKSDD